MITKTKFKNLIVVLCVMFTSGIIVYMFGKSLEKKEIRQPEPQYTQKYVDSLKSELFEYEIRIGRFEHILDMIDEMEDRQCKEKIDSIIDLTE
jgi:thiaminase